MFPHRLPVRRALVVVGLALVAAPGSLPAVARAQDRPTQGAKTTAAIDLTILNRDGTVPNSLDRSELIVTVDGIPRRVLWIRHVSRGPGALSEAASLRTVGGAMTFAAEPSRTVIVAVDQATLAIGDERAAVQAVWALLDRLGLNDRVGVVRLPAMSDMRVVLTTERPAVREVLGRVVGQAARAGNTLPGEPGVPTEPVRVSAVDPDRENTREPDRTPPPARQDPPPLADPRAGSAEVESPGARGMLPSLIGLLKALHPIPGRKTVALFSAGLPAPTASQITDAAAAASAARATVYAFGLALGSSGGGPAPDLGSLETLAKATGGSFVILGRKPERNLEQVARELSACFVVGVEWSDAEGEVRRRPLRVEVKRKGLTVKSAAWLATAADAGDVEVSTPAPMPVFSAPNRASAAAARPAEASARETELRTALARAADYLIGYERQYSGLVAEEDYQQLLARKSVRLRSDFLLVKAEKSEGWLSFRDVFEVDRRPVRDREDRLKRLFLDPTPEAQARLKAIADESARYNIGSLKRNINVPLLPLVFLTARYLPRCQFKVAKKVESNGVDAWRLEFEERASPTLVSDSRGRDVPAKGFFVIDQKTGAIHETSVEFKDVAFMVEIVVRYRRDGVLGLWVPFRMRETYRTPASQGSWDISIQCEASYSNFRRFQVNTEEKITIPK